MTSVFAVMEEPITTRAERGGAFEDFASVVALTTKMELPRSERAENFRKRLVSRSNGTTINVVLSRPMSSSKRTI